VVQAWRVCATVSAQQRAAVVLRCYAEMTFPQIAGTLDIKESVARTEVWVVFDRLRQAIRERRTDDAVECAFRDALAEHAEDLADSADRATPANAGAARRRRRRTLPAVAAATLLVAGLAGAAISYSGGGPETVKPESGAHPQGWRAESYNGIQLWVPSSWGWGEVPRQTTHAMANCGYGAYSPTSMITDLRFALEDGASAPYVGRPVGPGIACARRSTVTASHVWFDSPLPIGSGPAQTTFGVTGLAPFNVTVADANRTERSTILASVERVVTDASGCPQDAAGIRAIQSDARPEPSPRFVRTMSMCLFAGPVGHGVLYYSTRVDGTAARQATANIERAPDPDVAPICLVTPAPSQIVLIARTAEMRSLFVVNRGVCPEEPVGYVTGSDFHVLTERSLRLWAIDGLSLYATGGAGGERLTPFVPSP
jgi:hypothetical protein